MKISVVIITFNEEENIGACIDSVLEIADEIIVVDSYSTDETEKICKEKNVKFIQHSFDGYIEQKNFGMLQTENNFVLALDADERLSNELKKEIQKCISKMNPESDAFCMNRLNNYCGKWIKYGVWYPDKKIRLWNKLKGKWGGTNPHDKVVMKKHTTQKKLNGNILHYTVRTPEQYKLQMEKFSTIASEAMLKEGRKGGFVKAYSAAAYAFIRAYILRAGFLDGSAGFQIARGYAQYTKMKYEKTYRKNSNKA